MRRLTLITLFTCYALIFAGATVRATGSGLGCPDWPKCFGRWVPPTSEADLPRDYQSRFGAGEKFSAAKTWIEYANRLLGAVVGLQVLALLLFGLYRRRPQTPLRLLLFLLVAAQGLIGAVVVSSHLAASLITLHMLVAVAILLILVELSLAPNPKGNRPAKTVFAALLFTATAQLTLGTFVRRRLDPFLHEETAIPQTLWIDVLIQDPFFAAHRLLAYAFALTFIILVIRYRRILFTAAAKPFTMGVAVLLSLQFLSGLAFKALPLPHTQPPRPPHLGHSSHFGFVRGVSSGVSPTLYTAALQILFTFLARLRVKL